MDDADFTAKKVPVIPQEFLDVCCVCVAEAQPRGAATLTRHVCLQASDWHNAIGIARAMLLWSIKVGQDISTFSYVRDEPCSELCNVHRREHGINSIETQGGKTSVGSDLPWIYMV